MAETLGHTVEWIMNNMTYLELEAWVKYIEYKNEAEKKNQKG
jgi:hypothetical protein|tara:strand:- start:4952 stop:5077 length:126 start_codon:yes stop_codon:yes gene_type:complete